MSLGVTRLQHLVGLCLVLTVVMGTPLQGDEPSADSAPAPVAAAPAAESAPAEQTPVEPPASGTVESPAPSAETAPVYSLRFRYEPNQILRYISQDESVIEMAHSSEEMTVSHATKVWKHFRITSVQEDGSAVMQLMFDRVHMTAIGENGKIEFDSSRPGAPPAQFAHIVESVGRTSSEWTVNAQGEITAVKTFGGRASQGSSVSRSVVEGVDHNIRASLIVPEEPVAIGATWQERFEVPVLVEENKLTRKIKLQRTFTFTGVEGDIATIEVDTIVLTPIQDARLEAQLLQRTPSGLILFDREQGVMLSARTYLNNQVIGHEGAGSKLKVIRTVEETLAPAAEPASTAQAASSGGALPQ